MDPKHRDRIAFARICSGKFRKGMKLKHTRTGKMLTMHSPQLFLAQDRETAEEAFAGDILGLPNTGGLRIGDTLVEGNEDLQFADIPSFAPELMKRAKPEDPLKAKHLGKALEQLAEEGAASVFKTLLGSDFIVGVVGSLQFDVLADRIRNEYDIPVTFEPTELYTARWMEGEPAVIKSYVDTNRSAVANDHDGDFVFLARNAWHLQDAQDKNEAITFKAVK